MRLRSYGLVLIVNVLVISDLIRGLRIGRLILTILINLSRGQLLKGNRSLDRLLHLIRNSDLNLNLAVGGLRREGLLTSTQNGLAVLLINELSLQGVFLTRNQTLIGNLIHHLGTSNNLVRTVLEVSISRNLRGLLRWFRTRSLSFIRKTGLIYRHNGLRRPRSSRGRINDRYKCGSRSSGNLNRLIANILWRIIIANNLITRKLPKFFNRLWTSAFAAIKSRIPGFITNITVTRIGPSDGGCSGGPARCSRCHKCR